MTEEQALREVRARALQQRTDATVDSEEAQGFLWCR
jgi:hypothetical protein